MFPVPYTHLVTVIGEPDELRDAVVASFGKAVELIDMTKHEGQHPRMGAVDVVPFIPCRNTTVEEADAVAKEVAKIVGEKYEMCIRDRPSRPAGMSSISPIKSSRCRKWFISVSMAPQAMALTWILLGASSLASALVEALTPPLVAE